MMLNIFIERMGNAGYDVYPMVDPGTEVAMVFCEYETEEYGCAYRFHGQWSDDCPKNGVMCYIGEMGWHEFVDAFKDECIAAYRTSGWKEGAMNEPITID